MPAQPEPIGPASSGKETPAAAAAPPSAPPLSTAPSPVAPSRETEPSPPRALPAAPSPAVKTEVPVAKPAVKTPAKPPETANKAAPARPPAAAPTLDLASLEKRLKETSAIGVFTKLTLKNQVDDLLGQFRAYYQGKLKTSLAELRQPYDLLILKVMTLLQDGDPSLATAVRESREAIWGILSDPEKFKNL